MKTLWPDSYDGDNNVSPTEVRQSDSPTVPTVPTAPTAPTAPTTDAHLNMYDSSDSSDSCPSDSPPTASDSSAPTSNRTFILSRPPTHPGEVPGACPVSCGLVRVIPAPQKLSYDPVNARCELGVNLPMAPPHAPKMTLWGGLGHA